MRIEEIVTMRGLDDKCKDALNQEQLDNCDMPCIDIQLCNCQEYSKDALQCHSYCGKTGWLVMLHYDTVTHKRDFVVIHDDEDSTGHG